MAEKTIRWGVIGAGNVFEYKSGQALYRTPNSELVAVMRRDAAKSQDVAARAHKPVLCEKPMGTNTAEACACVEAC